MAHTVLQLMEKSGMPKTDLNLAIELIKDALWEIQRKGDADTYKEANNIVADQRYYGFPSDMVTLLKVYGYDSDEEKYFPAVAIPLLIDDHLDGNWIEGYLVLAAIHLAIRTTA